MDWSELPSLNALRAFAAVAETGSYSRPGVLRPPVRAFVKWLKHQAAAETSKGW